MRTLRDGENRRSIRGAAPALLLLAAAVALLVLHVLVLYLLLSPPYTSPERVLLWSTELGGLALLVYGAVLANRTFRSLRHSQRELEGVRQRLGALMDASPLAITAVDPDGRVLFWSAAAERIFGWTAAEVEGRPYPAVPADQVADWTELRRRVQRGETIMEVAGRRQAKDGRLIDVVVSVAPIGPETGVVGAVAVVADVTQRRAADRERERLESQLRQAQKMEAIGRLAGGVAHDFNNLLTAIKGHADLLLAGGSRGDFESDVEEIIRSSERAAALTRQLLAFTRQSIVEPRPLDLNALVGDMGALIRRLVGETVQVEMALSPRLGTVLADPGQVEQVLMNLVVNARDAMPGGGRITLETRNESLTAEDAGAYPYTVTPGPYVVLTVRDEGLGMDAETANQVFEPFFTTKPAGVGTGLGLSTVYGIVKQAGGYIWVDSQPGRGAAFRIYLPRIAAEPERAPETERKPRGPGGHETVLVVEDEEAVLALARKVLERLGYRVLHAGRGAEAIRIAESHRGPIHLLFCDVVMPDMTGRDAADRIRQIRPGIRVLMTSGYAEHVIARDGVLDAGIDFLPKPYTVGDLAARVREVLGHDDDRRGISPASTSR